MDKESQGKLNILDIFAFLIEWRRVWIPATLVCAFALGIYAFTAKERYRSVATVKGVDAESGGLGSLLASKFAGLSGFGGFGGGLTQTRGDYYLLILRGRSMSEKVIEQFNFRTDWNVEDAPIEDVIMKLASRTYFKYEAATNTIVLQVDDPDPVRAKSMCEFYIKELDQRNQEIESSKARKEREFTGARLSEARATLYALEDSMAAFQRESGIFDLEEQARATVQAVAALQAERLIARTEFELKRKLFEANNPELDLAQLKLSSIDSAFARMTGPSSGIEHDFLLHLDRATEDGKTYLRLYRDIEINQLLMAVLTQQYEQAKLNEARNTPTMVVIEPTAIGTKRVWPKRSFLVVLGAMLGFGLSMLYAGLVTTVRLHRDERHPGHESYRRLVRSWSK